MKDFVTKLNEDVLKYGSAVSASRQKRVLVSQTQINKEKK